MCEPTTILTAGAAVFGMMGSYDSAKAQKQSLQQNAEYDYMRAEDIIHGGEQSIFAARLKEAQLRGTQVASLAARGIDVGRSGSAMRILSDTSYISNLDVNQIADNASRQAWALRQKAGAEAGSASDISPGVSAFTSLLGGAASVSKTYATMTKA